jgi:hypothetical protein
VGLCDNSLPERGYHGYILVEHENQRLHPADETNERHDIGIDEATMNAIGYQAVTGVNGGIHSAFSLYKIPANTLGPLYDFTGTGGKEWAYSTTCSNALFKEENHFRFYKEDMLSVCNDTLFDQKTPCCRSDPTRPSDYCMNWHAFYMLAHQGHYQTCYIKVIVENGTGKNMQAISQLGNSTYPDDSCCTSSCADTDFSCNKCPQINDTVAVATQCLTSNRQAVCMEIRHSAQLYSCPGNPTNYDETLVTVKANDTCRLKNVSIPLLYNFKDKIVNIRDTSRFQMYMNNENTFSTGTGIYCVRDGSSIESAQSTALGMCQNGNGNFLTARKEKYTNELNWALKFQC